MTVEEALKEVKWWTRHGYNSIQKCPVSGCEFIKAGGLVPACAGQCWGNDSSWAARLRAHRLSKSHTGLCGNSELHLTISLLPWCLIKMPHPTFWDGSTYKLVHIFTKSSAEWNSFIFFPHRNHFCDCITSWLIRPLTPFSMRFHKVMCRWSG